MFALTLKELSLDPCTEKIYIGGADVKTVLCLKTQTVLLAFFFQNLLLFFTHRGNKGPDMRGRGFACLFRSGCGHHGVLPLVWAVLA
jgi:hypothetical protein